jgi:hypothetical protein
VQAEPVRGGSGYFAASHCRYRDDPDPVLRQVVAGGQLSEGITLSEMGRSRDAAGAYRQLIDRHGGDPSFSVLVERGITSHAHPRRACLSTLFRALPLILRPLFRAISTCDARKPTRFALITARDGGVRLDSGLTDSFGG